MHSVVELATPTEDYGSIQNPAQHITRPLWKDMTLEFLGTLMFVYISLAGVNQAGLTGSSQVHVALCFAFGLTAGILVAGKSGGHLNPAVTLTTFMTSPMFGFERLLGYIAAQICGGFCAGLLVLSVYYSWESSMDDSLFIGSYGTLKAGQNSLFAAILDQFIGSALLMLGICLTPDSWSKPITIGTVLGSLALFQGTNGFAFNPARDLGPRLASAIVFGSTVFSSGDYWFWVPLVVPCFGVMFGWVMAQFIEYFR